MSTSAVPETTIVFPPVRAKFKCHGMEKTLGWSDGIYHYSYRFTVVTSGSAENEKFFAATPSGELKLTALRNDLFEVGQEYYLDFSKAF